MVDRTRIARRSKVDDSACADAITRESRSDGDLPSRPPDCALNLAWYPLALTSRSSAWTMAQQPDAAGILVRGNTHCYGPDIMGRPSSVWWYCQPTPVIDWILLCEPVARIYPEVSCCLPSYWRWKWRDPLPFISWHHHNELALRQNVTQITGWRQQG